MRYIKKLYHNVWYRLTHFKPHESTINDSWQIFFVPEEFPEGPYGAPIGVQAADRNKVRKPMLDLVVGSRKY